MERKLSEMEEELKVTKSMLIEYSRLPCARVYKPVSPNNQSLDTRGHPRACACVCLEQPVCSLCDTSVPAPAPLTQIPGHRSHIHIIQSSPSPIPAQHKRNYTNFPWLCLGCTGFIFWCFFRSRVFGFCINCIFVVFFIVNKIVCVCESVWILHIVYRIFSVSVQVLISYCFNVVS